MTLTFDISSSIKTILPKARLGVITCEVIPKESTDLFLKNLSILEEELKNELSVVSESKLGVIAETRKAYKICGKEPSRYRTSAEALLRRIRQGKDLYRINNIVDTINCLSISSQYSIGGFDAEKIKGNVILDIGDANNYQAIGRGLLNIESMPGLKDSLGFFGTPTSDSERTMVTHEINKLALVYYDFYGNDNLDKALVSAKELLSLHCDAKDLKFQIVD